MSKMVCVFLIFLFPNIVKSQQNSTDTSFISASAQEEIQNYNSIFWKNSPIFNGVLQTQYPDVPLSHPYLDPPEWKEGYVVYDGIFYKPISLKYDLVADNLIVRTPTGLSINPFKPRVNSFFLENKKFIYINTNEFKNIKAGFYQSLVSGKISIIAKFSKVKIEKMTLSIIETKYEQSRQFFLFHDKNAFEIKTVKSLAIVTGLKKKQIKKIFRQSDLNFRKDRAGAISKIAEYYNSK
ncbi:MAG: hypothetical protein NVSMB67_28670 [Flavisolibacter sp.]